MNLKFSEEVKVYKQLNSAKEKGDGVEKDRGIDKYFVQESWFDKQSPKWN